MFGITVYIWASNRFIGSTFNKPDAIVHWSANEILGSIKTSLQLHAEYAETFPFITDESYNCVRNHNSLFLSKTNSFAVGIIKNATFFKHFYSALFSSVAKECLDLLFFFALDFFTTGKQT